MILKNAKIYGKDVFDLRIENGKISEIAKNINSNDDEIIDLNHKTLLPSFIDLNVNLQDNEFSVARLYELEKKCLKGGISTIILRDNLDANTQMSLLYFDRLKELKINAIPVIKIVDKDAKLKDISILVDAGAKGLEISSDLGANFLRQGMQYAKLKDVKVFLKCFNKDFDDNGVMNDSATSFELGLIGISDIAELSEVAKMKEIVEFYEVDASFDCLGLKKSFELLRAKNTEISLHHLIKCEKDCKEFNTYAKILPPLRNTSEVKELMQIFKEGCISFLSILQSPSSYKDLAFDEASFGVDSIEYYVSLCYTYLIKNAFMSWEDLCQFTCQNQAKFLGLNKGFIKVGYDADLVVFDENKTHFAPKNSLYANDELFGEVVMHMIKGKMF